MDFKFIRKFYRVVTIVTIVTECAHLSSLFIKPYASLNQMIHNLNCCCVWQKEINPESSTGIPEFRTATAADQSAPALDKGKHPEDKLKNDVFYQMQVQNTHRMDRLDKDVLSIKNSLSEVVEYMKTNANHTSSLAHTGPKTTLEDTSSESSEDEDDAYVRRRREQIKLKGTQSSKTSTKRKTSAKAKK